MDPGPSFFLLYITIQSTANCFLSLQTIFFHTVQLILCFQQTSELDKLTASWGKVVWLCCAGLHDAGSAPCHKSVCFNLGEDLLSPTGSINLGFLLRENLLLSSSYLPLGVSQQVLHHHLSGDSKRFSGAVAGERESFFKSSQHRHFLVPRFLQGESFTSNFFTLFLFA